MRVGVMFDSLVFETMPAVSWRGASINRRVGQRRGARRSKMFLRVLLLSALVACAVQGYMYRERLDTSGGACVGEWGSIPVGADGYDDARCERISCVEGMRINAGCGTVAFPPECRLVRGTGHYPDCCPRPECPKH